MKQAKWVVAVTLVVLSGMAAAQLMSSSARIAAQVPFEFVVANKIVPAGDWVVQTATMDGKTLMIRNTDAKLNLFATASPTENKQSASDCALVFERYGDQYFLSGIRLQGSKIAYHLPESRAEAELRAQNVSAKEVTLLASLQY